MSTTSITALYGTFNFDQQPISTIDVTAKIKPFVQQDKVVLPAGINFDSLFGYVPADRRRQLQLNINGRLFMVADDTYAAQVVIGGDGSAPRISIVYYVYISTSSNWRAIISGQLLQLKSFGILNEAELYIHITDTRGLINKINTLITDIVPEANISISYDNQFEYPALKLLHELAVEKPQNTFLYFHTKGMSHQLHSRLPAEEALFTNTFESWRKHIQNLHISDHNKAGLFPALGGNDLKEEAGSMGGWIWYNFWYAKGKYLANLPAPELTDNRYVYEHWIGGSATGDAPVIKNDCLSLYPVKNTRKVSFRPTEADLHMANVVYKTFSSGLTHKMHWFIRSPFLIQCYARYLAWRKK